MNGLPHICLCLSDETLKAGGPFYLVSMPGEVKDPTKCVTCSGLTNSRWNLNAPSRERMALVGSIHLKKIAPVCL